MSRLLALLLALTALAGCTESVLPRTQVLVQIDASDAIKARAQELRVTLDSGKGSDPAAFDVARVERFTLDETFSWPASLALVPRGGATDRGFRIFVEALDETRTFVTARVISYFLADQTLLLEIVLDDNCVDYLGCGEQDTCMASGDTASCSSAKVDPRGLPALGKGPGRERDASVRPDAQVVADAAVEPAADAATEDAAEVDGGGPMPEQCFNGADDDGDSLIDCADDDCTVGAVCAVDSAELVLKLPAGTPCPMGYDAQSREVHRELTSEACTGCSCGQASATTCLAQVNGYDAPGGCGAGFELVQAAQISNFNCSPSMQPALGGLYDAIGLGAVYAQPGTCPASGSPVPGPVHWGDSVTLCTLKQRGAGCASGSVCIPRVAEATLCETGVGNVCATGLVQETWYAGYSEQRACGPCTCAASGASCAGVSLRFGNDYSCGTRAVLPGQVNCTQTYAPLANLVGTPTLATCTPSSETMGTAQLTGPTTLCCRP